MSPSSLTCALALVSSMFLAFAPCCACAWSNGGFSADVDDPDYGTHDWIADEALGLQVLDVSFLETTYHTTYLLATEAPDNPVYIGDTAEHHVYFRSSGALQDDSAAVRASEMYSLALGRLVAGDYPVAAYYIGAMTHYIADMGVFGHTMGVYTDWGAEEHHSDYEAAFEDRLGSFVSPSGGALGNMTAYDAALDLAYDVTFGAGEIMPNVWMDDNYDWDDDAFEASAKASLHGAVLAVAAALNHLLTEADSEPRPQPTAPGVPTDLEGYAEHGGAVLIWGPPSDDGGSTIVEYIIYRGDSTDNRAQVATTGSGTLRWTDGDVEPGGTYHYWVAARNSAGVGETSGPVSVSLPSEDGSLLLPAVAAALLASLASAVTLMLRRRSR